LAFPNEAEWWHFRAFMVVVVLFWAGVWAAVAVRGWWRWSRYSPRERRLRAAFLVAFAGILAIPATLLTRDVRALRAWPFDPDQIESITVEVYRDYQPAGSYQFEGGSQVAAGFRLLEQSGKGIDFKSQIPRDWPHVRYRVRIRLRGEPTSTRYLDAYPRTQRGVPGVVPGWAGSHADLGMYGSEAFVRWLEAIVGGATPAEPSAPADRGGM
jgi:hypothetical protein